MTTAFRFARILRADELRDGELIPVEIDGTPVVLVRHAGEFFAVQNNCSHKDFPLSEAGFEPVSVPFDHSEIDPGTYEVFACRKPDQPPVFIP